MANTYEVVEIENFGLIRIMKEENKEYPYSLQFITTKLNKKPLDWEDIQEYALTKKDFESLFKKIKELGGFG